MFKFRISNPKILKDMITAISVLIDEGTFKLEPEGIKLRAMDPSRVAMVDFEWPKTIFEEYICEQSTKICVNISELLKLIKRASKDEVIDFSVDEKSGRLQLEITGKYTRKFNMSTLNLSEETVPVPKVTFNAKIKATTEGLSHAIVDAQLVSDHVKIIVNNEKLVFDAAGELMGAVITIEKGNDALLELDVAQPSQATFSLSYLSEIIKAASATSDIATMEFSTDMPIKLDFQQPREGKLSFYLAPRIETE